MPRSIYLRGTIGYRIQGLRRLGFEGTSVNLSQAREKPPGFGV